MNTLLQVSGLRKTYGGTHGAAITLALADVSFAVEAGAFVSVMGPSGSGKTTLLNLLAGLDTPTGGEIMLNGQPYSTLDGERRAAFRRTQLGFVFQDYQLLDTLTLAENVALPLLLARRDPAALVREVLEHLGIAALADRFPYQVSGGQQQRAAVARAIVHGPALVLADEPTGNLDSAASRALLEQFTALNARSQVTIVMVTHDPQAASYAQRVVFLRDGALYTTLEREGLPPHAFFGRILDTLGALEKGEPNG
jgi:ABC-type lipoprotein export system ATPase subunit